MDPGVEKEPDFNSVLDPGVEKGNTMLDPGVGQENNGNKKENEGEKENENKNEDETKPGSGKLNVVPRPLST